MYVCIDKATRSHSRRRLVTTGLFGLHHKSPIIRWLFIPTEISLERVADKQEPLLAGEYSAATGWREMTPKRHGS